MNFRSTSIDEVIARIIRNTRLQDSSFIPDMLEWIPEAMGQLKTSMELTYKYYDCTISFHKGKMPCGLIDLIAVEYEGARLPYSSTAKHYATGHNLANADPNMDSIPTFQSVIATVPNDTYIDQNNILWTSDISPTKTLKAVQSCDVHPSHWYSFEMDWMTTSIADGVLRLHYYSRPLDVNGLPLIPDNENYKEAIYCYVRAKLIGAGFKDTVYNERELMERFETYGRRAINEITYPTPDQKEQQVKTQVRLIPPDNYWSNFFRVDNHENPYV